MSDQQSPIGADLIDYKPPLEPSAAIGERPQLRWIEKEKLVVDRRYQRDAVNARSRQLIRKIVEGFAWSRFQPITVAAVAGAVECYTVIDGQHRATAALLHPAVATVPCWIVEAPETKARAKAFVGINRDRVGMLPIQIFWAELAAGDPDAVQIDRVVRAAGGRVSAYQRSSADLVPGEVLAISTLRKLLALHGEAPVKAALTALFAAFPETAAQIRGQVITAATQITARYRQRLDAIRLARAIAEHDTADLLEQVRRYKQASGSTTEQLLAAAYLRAYNKGLRPAERLGDASDAA